MSGIPVVRVGMFAKYWRPGCVKTRLAASIGEDAAAALHRVFVRRLLERVAVATADIPGVCRELWAAPDNQLEAFRPMAEEFGWSVTGQGSGDLGARMRRFFESGPRPAVLIGSDSPNLPRTCFSQAFDALGQAPVVLGPAEDGGYYLIGVAETIPPIFEGMPWSEPSLWSVTMTRLQQAGRTPHILPRWYDVDELPDLDRLRSDLERTASSDALDAALLADIRLGQ